MRILRKWIYASNKAYKNHVMQKIKIKLMILVWLDFRLGIECRLFSVKLIMSYTL